MKTESSNLIRDVDAKVNGYDLLALTMVGASNRFRSSLGELPEQTAAMRDGSIMVIRYP